MEMQQKKNQNLSKNSYLKLQWSENIYKHTLQAHTGMHTHNVVECSVCQGTILPYDNRVRDRIMCLTWGKYENNKFEVYFKICSLPV